MAAMVGNTSQGYQGIHLGTGPNGPVALFMGSAAPNSIVDPVVKASDGTVVSGPSTITAARADIGSLYIQAGIGVWVKTSLGQNGWQQLTVP